MRINKFIALATGLSRRKADDLLESATVRINGALAEAGAQVDARSDTVTVNGNVIRPSKTQKSTIVLLNKPVGVVCSHDGQGSKTVFDLLPPKFRNFKIAGRLDKDSSGLVVLTDSGELVQELTHPSGNKQKVYEVTLNKPLSDKKLQAVTKTGIDIGDKRPSKFKLTPTDEPSKYIAKLHEGRNRQIRRTFATLGYNIITLHRIRLGNYTLGAIQKGVFKAL